MLSLSAASLAMPVYDTDSRSDVHQVRSGPAAGWARSVGALFSKSRVWDSGQLALRPYGATRNLSKNDRFYDQKAGAVCSGALIAPDLLLTAGHCLKSSPCEQTYVIFDYYLDSPERDLSRPRPDSVFRCVAVEHSALSKDELDDFAVIRLDRSAGRPPLKIARALPRPGAALTAIGASDGMPLKIDSGARVRYVSPKGFFMADIDAFPANSGSPVLDSATGEILGVLIGSALSDFRRRPDGTYAYEIITPEILEDVGGEYVISSSRIRELMRGSGAPVVPPVALPSSKAVLKLPSL